MNDRTQRNQRYIAGVCVDCGTASHSPGRPRCDECHMAHVPVFEPELKRRGEAKGD